MVVWEAAAGMIQAQAVVPAVEPSEITRGCSPCPQFGVCSSWSQRDPLADSFVHTLPRIKPAQACLSGSSSQNTAVSRPQL